MENALYYTFSTIAQALAGTVALLAAFVLFKLQSIDSEISREHAPRVMEHFVLQDNLGDHPQQWTLYVHGRWVELLATLRDDKDLPPYDAMHLARMRALVATRGNLTASLKLVVRRLRSVVMCPNPDSI